MMGSVLKKCLYKKYKNEFDRISDMSKEFLAVYCGKSVLSITIFSILENYARKKDLDIEILRYPFNDTKLWAFTFVKKGTVFLCINTELAMCKQFFAVAHELYHIVCYAENPIAGTEQVKSLLDAKKADDIDTTLEESEANAFAGLLLMPDLLIREHIALFGINGANISVDDVLILMDVFAIPYKAVIIRLFESEVITEAKANELLAYDDKYLLKRMEITGKAVQWQMDSLGIAYFGSLVKNLEYNSELELLTESREQSDREYIEGIKKQFDKRWFAYGEG